MGLLTDRQKYLWLYCPRHGVIKETGLETDIGYPFTGFITLKYKTLQGKNKTQEYALSRKQIAYLTDKKIGKVKLEILEIYDRNVMAIEVRSAGREMDTTLLNSSAYPTAPTVYPMLNGDIREVVTRQQE